MNNRKKVTLLFAIFTVLPALLVLYVNLPNVIDAFLFDWLGFNPQLAWSKSVNFFLYDTIKILILLFLISTLMGVVNAYFPIDRVRHFLTTKKLYGFQYFFASFFGAITPFCSCSSIPLFIGFVKGGIPLGVTFSFLITSPLVNEVAVALFLGLFGLKATLVYAGSGIVLGVVGGYVLGKFKLERYLTEWVLQVQHHSNRAAQVWEGENTTFIERLPNIVQDGWDVVRKVLIYVLVGIAIGAGIHGFVPENFFANFLTVDSWYTVPMAVLLGVPMYANAAAIVPVVGVLVTKGVPLGTAIAFMMAVVGLSIPEATLLKKVMTWKLIGIYFGTISFFIILLGYLFNLIL